MWSANKTQNAGATPSNQCRVVCVWEATRHFFAPTHIHSRTFSGRAVSAPIFTPFIACGTLISCRIHTGYFQVIVADTENHCIRSISVIANLMVNTLAGAGAAGRFSNSLVLLLTPFPRMPCASSKTSTETNSKNIFSHVSCQSNCDQFLTHIFSSHNSVHIMIRTHRWSAPLLPPSFTTHTRVSQVRGCSPATQRAVLRRRDSTGRARSPSIRCRYRKPLPR